MFRIVAFDYRKGAFSSFKDYKQLQNATSQNVAKFESVWCVSFALYFNVSSRMRHNNHFKKRLKEVFIYHVGRNMPNFSQCEFEYLEYFKNGPLTIKVNLKPYATQSQFS